MTVQDAIRTMEYFDRNFGDYKPNHEAIQMAIEALTHFNSTSNSIKSELNELSCSEEPNKSDTIYRKDAIDAINTWDKFGVDERGRLVRWHEGLELYVHLRDVLTTLVNLSSAEWKGKWIKEREEWFTDYPYKCTNCGKYSRARYHFCPNCGADMRGDKHEVD